ncbi:MAG: hypothetical protein KatS3mg124_1550 [Porticoccaceae bacterium]|nr:MAG: hypothetical protein KatS3mg124_1550 [Porticoccaceae bacterium]
MARAGRGLILVAALWAALPAAGGQPPSERLEALDRRIAELERALAGRRRQVSRLERELAAREIEAAQLLRRERDLAAQIARLEEALAELAAERARLEEQRAARSAEVAGLLAAAYRLGGAEPLRVLLGAQDPAQLARTLAYYRYFAADRAARLSAYRATLEALTANAAATAARRAELEEARREVAAARRALEREKAQRSRVLAALRAALADDSARLLQLAEERRRLEAVLTRLDRELDELAAGDPFPAHRGKLPWPAAGRVANRFGGARGAGLTWSGWLIEAPEGSPVRAVHRGRVAFAGYLRGHGLLLILDHGDGFLSLYAHNRLLLREEGEWVEGGEEIAQVGSTGGLARSALYFEIRQNGKPLDPARWLARRG